MVQVIDAQQRNPLPSPKTLLRYRDLAYFLVRRDIGVRYKQTIVGASWAVLQPIALAAVFSVFLGSLAKVPSPPGIRYPLYALSGLAIWVFVTGGITAAANSTLASEQLITKAYFPRMILPLASLGPALLDMVVALAVVVIAGILYGHAPSVRLLLLPLPLLAAIALTAGLGLFLSALTVRYRDVQLVVPFSVIVGLFVTPVMYPFDLVPKGLQAIYSLNPMVGILEAYRWCLFGQFTGSARILAISGAATFVIALGGTIYFNRAERTFADVI